MPKSCGHQAVGRLNLMCYGMLCKKHTLCDTAFEKHDKTGSRTVGALARGPQCPSKQLAGIIKKAFTHKAKTTGNTLFINIWHQAKIWTTHSLHFSDYSLKLYKQGGSILNIRLNNDLTFEKINNYSRLHSLR